MHINDEITLAYLNGVDVTCFSNNWYFTNSVVSGNIGENIFTSPCSDSEMKDKVKIVYDAIYQKVSDFTPSNIAIWDVLFDDWKEVFAEIDVDLIMGFPEPYDATIEYDKMGKCHVIFDLGCWSKYVGHCDLSLLVQNILTHELCHVLLQKHSKNLKKDLTSTDYVTALDAITFDEGFAHLVSYEAKEINEINWNDNKLLEIYESNKVRMKSALVAEDTDTQQLNLYEALCGNYYEKYACMCGMFYLAHKWYEGGNQTLKDLFYEGYKNFANKTII